MSTKPGSRPPGPGAASLLGAILAALDATRCAYALIHPPGTLDEAVRTDVDLAFDRDPNEILLPIVARLCGGGSARLVQRLHYDVPHGYYYILRTERAPAEFLHLDCLFDPLGINRYRLPTPFLLHGAVRGPLGMQAAPDRMAIYLLLKRAIKGETSPEQIDEIAACFDDAHELSWHRAQEWLGPRARALVKGLLEANSQPGTCATLARLRQDALAHFARKHPLSRALSRVLDAKRKLKRLARPTGVFVVLLGPDGSGKSTVGGLVVSELERAFRRTWRFHWRPNLLPKLRPSVTATAYHGPETVQPTPAEVSKYHGAVSLARFVYYWLDFVVGYWLLVYPRKARTTLIVAERYFPDVMVNPERYGFAVPARLMQLARKCVPSPDLLILLKDDPEAIHARKPELSPDKIARQLAAYEDEAKHWGEASVVITQGGAATVAGRIADLIMDKCTRRLSSRLEQDERTPQWRAFPTATNAKVWVGDNETLAIALNLYHPYSKSGQLAKAVAACLPRAAQHCLFRERPDIGVRSRLRVFTNLIRQTLRDDLLEVSFSPGTPGPHQKITAQAARGHTVVSYVKIADDPSISGLLQQEAEMLAWLNRKNFSAGAFPLVMAFDHHEGDTLLFLSPPKTSGRQRCVHADDKDVQFLSALALLLVDTIPVGRVFEQMRVGTNGEMLTQRYSHAGDLLRDAVRLIYSSLGTCGVRVTPCHGDYAPWNTLEVERGRLYVFDWEYGAHQWPALSDMFHRVMMPARLVLGERPASVVDRLLRLADDPVLSRLISAVAVPRGQLLAYVVMYLIGQLIKGGHETPDEFIIESIRYCLTLSGHVIPRRKVLISAYACEPGRGSEPGVGWHMCQVISREHDAWVITRKNNRHHVESALIQHPNPNLHFYYADLPAWMRRWKRGERGIRLYYYLWQFAALREAIKLMRTVRFDVAHHVTFVNDFTFTFLALLPIPFVWGPIGSVSKRPGRLTDGKVSLLRERTQYYLKTFLRSLDPLFWLSAARAKVVIGINSAIGERFPLSLLTRNKYMVHPAIGVEEKIARASLSRTGPSNGFRIISIGRLVPLKAFHLAVKAFAILCQNEPAATLTIVGDGQLRQSLERLAAGLNVRERVNFVQWLPRSKALELMRQSDVFLFPSFEAAGMVVLEAMAHGLPVVCLQRSGPADLITKECGFAVPVGPMKNTVDKLANALEALARDRALRVKMGAEARRVIQDKYLWEDRQKTIMHWYLAAGMTVLPKRHCGA